MTPRTERTGSIGRAALAGQLHHQMGWNKIAELPEDGKLATSWRVLVFFHPCRVAGKFLPRQLFFYSGCGMTVRSAQKTKREFNPDFSSVEPLLKLGLTPRASETLLWLSQGKTNSDIAAILGITESTVKKYVQEIFEKLAVETRCAATVRALEVLYSSSS
jgi:DNA-binding CsgD family transcriptional regulator